MVRAVANVNDRAVHYKYRAERLEAALVEIGNDASDALDSADLGQVHGLLRTLMMRAHEALNPVDNIAEPVQPGYIRCTRVMTHREDAVCEICRK